MGIETSELIQQNLEEFKTTHPDVRSLDQDMLKFRYNASEKFRIQSINLIKKEREKIIDEAEEIKIGKDNTDQNRKTYTNMSKTHFTTNSKEKWATTNQTTGEETDEKMEKIFSEQKKSNDENKAKTKTRYSNIN